MLKHLNAYRANRFSKFFSVGTNLNSLDKIEHCYFITETFITYFIGKVTEGDKVLRKIENISVNSNNIPIISVTFVDCGMSDG